MSKWLLKHYFRWNEKHNQKQSFDWIQGLCWTLPPNSSLLLSTFAPWCQLHHFPHYVSLESMNTYAPFSSLISLPLSPSRTCLSSSSLLSLLALLSLFPPSLHSLLPFSISSCGSQSSLFQVYLCLHFSVSLPSLSFISDFFNTRYSLCALFLPYTCLQVFRMFDDQHFTIQNKWGVTITNNNLTRHSETIHSKAPRYKPHHVHTCSCA